MPRDDSGGHYTCHATTGARICRSGWSNPRNYCRTREWFLLYNRKLVAFNSLVFVSTSLTLFKLCVPATATVKEATALLLVSVFVTLAGVEVDVVSASLLLDAVSAHNIPGPRMSIPL